MSNREALLEMQGAAGIESAEEAINRLAALPSLEYGQQRQAASGNLGVALKFLDRAVADARSANGTGKKTAQGSELTFEEIFPSEEPVDGTELAQALITIIKRFMVLPSGATLTIALWILRTFIFDEFGINPILAARSPEKQCGKTTLLELLFMLVPKPILTSNCTPASLFRVIEKCQPTLLIDEMDSFQDGNDALRGILNSCHNRQSAKVIRTVGDDHEPRQFSTWAPVVLAAIGKLPDTVEDRSLRIDLQRKAKTDTVCNLPRHGRRFEALKGDLDVVRAQCMRWTQDHLDAIRNADIQELPELSPRANDNWNSLLSVAAAIGPEYLKRAKLAAVTISATTTEDVTIKTQLLIDIHELFKTRAVDKMASQDICDSLSEMDERPWATWRKGKAISTNQLARLLRDFGVKSQTIRPKGEPTIKGYYMANFQDSWGRYCGLLSGDGALKRHAVTTCMDKGRNPNFQSVTETPCDVSENDTLANDGAGCDGVPDENQECRAGNTQLAQGVLDLC